VSLEVNGGAGGANDVLDFTSDGTNPVSVTLPDNTTSPPTKGAVTQIGLTPIRYTGLTGINVDSAVVAGNQTSIPAFTVFGTQGVDNIAYTPTGAQSGSVTSAGLTINFKNVAGSFTIDPLGVSPLGTQGDTVAVIGTNVTPAFPAKSDIFTLSNIAGAPSVSFGGILNGAKTLTLVQANTASLVLSTLAGDDNVIVDSSAGAFLIPVTYDGGTGRDTLTFSGGGSLGTTYWAGPNPGQGVVQIDFAAGSEIVNFLNLAPVVDLVPGTLTVVGTNDNDTIGYTNAAAVGNGLVTINALETIEFTNKTALTLLGIGGDDTITVNNPATPTGLAAITVNGGAGNDTLVVNANGKAVLSSDITSTTVGPIAGAVPVAVAYAAIDQVKVINAADALTGTGVPITGPEGVLLENVLVATFQFTDPQPPTITADASEFVATIDWGDGTIPTAGTIVQTAPDAAGVVTFQVYGAHTFAKAGPLVAKVTIFDKGSARSFTPAGGVPTMIQDNSGATTVVSPIVVTVTGSLLSSQGVTVAPTEGKSFTGVVATFTDSNPNAMVSDFTTPGSVVIDWGDGTVNDNNTTPLIVVVTQIGASGNGVNFSVKGTHTYLEEGTYQVLVTITAKSLSSTVALSNAVVADSPPTPSVIQPAINATEGVQFFGAVAAFTEIYTDGARINAEPLGDFTAKPPVINWGDGTPPSAGTVIEDPVFPPASGHFLVTGIHIYADAGVNGGVGHFTVSTTVFDGDGTTAVTINNTANVTDVPITLTGILNPASDSGKSHFDAITNVAQPNFYGTSEAFSDIQLFANGVLVGQTQAGSDGSWSITSNHLADGSYAITATAIDQFGKTTTVSPTQILPSATQGLLVIDTVGPRVTAASLDRLTSTVTFTFQDFQQNGATPGGSGLLVQSLSDAANYSLNRVRTRPPGKFIVTSLSVIPGAGPASQNVTVVFNNGAFLRGGFFQIIARSANVVGVAGIQDLAGNALDGEFYGPASASGNGVPGGNFVANVTAIHNGNSGPITIIGFPHPNDPPAAGKHHSGRVKKTASGALANAPKTVIGKSQFAHRQTLAPKAASKLKTSSHVKATKVSLLRKPKLVAKAQTNVVRAK
jgi:hypothetical protein